MSASFAAEQAERAGGFPRVLVISHNVIGGSTGMGRTMESLLACVPKENLYHLYFHAEVPTKSRCSSYFRITDGEVARSVLTRRAAGAELGESDINVGAKTSRVDTGVAAKAYQRARRRTPLTYAARNVAWKLGVWHSDTLLSWLRRAAPDVVFFASGDYSFAYRVACWVSDVCRAPLVLWCVDDYFLTNRHENSFLGRLVHGNLTTWMHRVRRHAACAVVICDKMARDYETLLTCPIHVMRIGAAENSFSAPFCERSGIVYAGSLGVGRVKPLVELGRALKAAGREGLDCVYVYTADANPRVLDLVVPENGLVNCGVASPEELERIQGKAKFLLHVESFDEQDKARTRYSLSTKVGSCLQSGACLVAYGPRDIASMEYLAQAEAALIVDSAHDLPELLETLGSDKDAFAAYVTRARTLAKSCHNAQMNNRMMELILRSCARVQDASNEREAIR